MAVGSQYAPLAEFLSGHPADAWDARFEDIEKVLRRRLPASAYQYQAWWANQSGKGHSQTHGWRSAGWRTAKLDLERRRVRFERDTDAPRQGITAAQGDLWARARKVTGILERDQLIEEALKALIERTIADRLIALGGSMPNFTVPPRERPSA